MAVAMHGNLKIVPLSEVGLPMAYALNTDTAICMGAGFWRDAPTYEAFCAWTLPTLSELCKDKMHFMVVLKDITDIKPTDVLGIASAVSMSDVHRTAEVSVRIRKDMQGHGVASEVIELLLHWLFIVRGYRKVYAQIYRSNVASQKLFVKCGFLHEATLRKHEMHYGNYEDVLIYSMWKQHFVWEDI